MTLTEYFGGIGDMRRSIGEKLFDRINILFLGVFCFFTAYPFYYIVIYSLSIPVKAASRGVYLLPAGFTFMNYINIFQQNNILHAAFISVSKTVVGTLLTIVCCGLFSYSVTKGILPFRKFMYRSLVLSMYISIGIIPVYITYRYIGLKNNFLVYILPNMVNAFYIVLMKTYFEQLPVEVEESAMIDGAGYFSIFIRIILPVSKPILATVAIFQAVGLWNSYSDNLYFASVQNLQTLQLLLYTFLQQQVASNTVRAANAAQRGLIKLTPTSVRMTITVIATLPILFVYPFLQKYFMKGLLIGAVKG